MSKFHNVVFSRKWDVYQAGDRAGFAKGLAEHLIKSGVARAFEALPVAKKGEDIPEAGMNDKELEAVRESQRVLKQQEEAEDRALQAKEARRERREKRGIFPGGGGKHKG